MSSQLQYLQNCIDDARDSKDVNALEVLRSIIERVSARAPAEAVIEIAETLVRIRKRDARLDLEAN